MVVLNSDVVDGSRIVSFMNNGMFLNILIAEGIITKDRARELIDAAIWTLEKEREAGKYTPEAIDIAISQFEVMLKVVNVQKDRSKKVEKKKRFFFF